VHRDAAVCGTVRDHCGVRGASSSKLSNTPANDAPARLHCNVYHSHRNNRSAAITNTTAIRRNHYRAAITNTTAIRRNHYRAAITNTTAIRRNHYRAAVANTASSRLHCNV